MQWIFMDLWLVTKMTLSFSLLVLHVSYFTKPYSYPGINQRSENIDVHLRNPLNFHILASV